MDGAAVTLAFQRDVKAEAINVAITCPLAAIFSPIPFVCRSITTCQANALLNKLHRSHKPLRGYFIYFSWCDVRTKYDNIANGYENGRAAKHAPCAK